jgi:hypothetical protein
MSIFSRPMNTGKLVKELMPIQPLPGLVSLVYYLRFGYGETKIEKLMNDWKEYVRIG